MVEDHPGTMAKFTDVLGRNEISIRSVLQHEPPEDEEEHRNGRAIVPVVITTDLTTQGQINAACKALAELDAIHDRPVCIGIVDEHPERLSEQ
jgi:ACT domain-containing protein